MKKKLLIVFLICCIMFGVASPAMAADFPEPSPDWGSYIIVDGAIPAYESKYPHSRFAVATVTEGVEYSVSLNSDGAVSQIYQNASHFSNDDMINYGIYVYTSDESGLYSWKVLFGNRFYPSNGDFGAMSDDAFTTFTFNSYVSTSIVYIQGTDEVFIPPLTLEETTLAVIQGTTQILPTLDGNLQILVPFGIICLALLVGLVLLRKIFRTFQR